MASRDLSAACSHLRALVPGIVASLGGTDRIRPVCVERTQLEQQFEYAKGRTLPGRRVTNADGVQKLSPHQRQVRHGEDAVHAVDLGVFDERGRYVNQAAAYEAIGPAAEARGLVWGGRWRSPVDKPHVECPQDGVTLEGIPD